MRPSLALVGAGVAACLATAFPLLPGTASAATPAVITSGVTALYQMNEPPGSTVMTDSSGNGLNGTIDPTGVQTGAAYNGSTGYNWVRRNPTDPPPSPERIIQVPDNIALEPGDQTFTIEIRYRTKEKFGNIIQKGQAQTKGGQWKIQNPGGIPQCLFKGSKGQVGTGAKTAINDNEWHTLTCVFSSTDLTMYVDGVQRNHQKGVAGTVDNSFPMTVGGKIDCDQIKVTCDYFSGQIDYVKISKGGNQPPVAGFTSSCAGTVCAFDSSTSSDPDGGISAYAWAFGDGGTSTAANPSHSYATAGTYNVTLKVTDGSGATNSLTQSVMVGGGGTTSPVAFVGSAAVGANNANPTLTFPAAAQPGQRVVMVLSINNLARTVGAPTGVTGWTQLGTQVSGSMSSTAWSKLVEPGDPGHALTVPLSGGAKYNLTVADYSGVDPAASVTFASASDTVLKTTRLTPTVVAPAGSWVVSYWADKSSTTTAWTADASVTTRANACVSPNGQICSVLADSAAAVPPGSYGNVPASTNAASSTAAMWSVVLTPSP